MKKVKKIDPRVKRAADLKERVAKADGYMKAGMSRIAAIHKAGLWYRQYLTAKKIKSLQKVRVEKKKAA